MTHPNLCDRCRAALDASIMSKFNTDTLCLPCANDESMAPGYARASAAEAEALRRGNRNFPGIGLSGADEAFLAARRARRN